MRVNGNCHCGNIVFEAEVDPKKVQICHCLDCQKLTGSAFRITVQAKADSFRLLQGDPKVYFKVADSGSRRGHAFCGDCGSPVYRLPTDNSPNYSLRVGGLHQRAAFDTPARQIWVNRRLPWVTEISAIREIKPPVQRQS